MIKLNGIPNFYGKMPVIINEAVPNYMMIPVKKHRRKRIQKKWIKRYGLKQSPATIIYRIGKNLICNKNGFEKIKNHFAIPADMIKDIQNKKSSSADMIYPLTKRKK